MHSPDKPEEVARVRDILKAEIGQTVRDMANHVGDQIFDVLKRNGLLMRSEASSTGMMVLAAIQILAQAADQCSRAAEEDCTAPVVALFLDCLPDNLSAAVRKHLLEETHG